MRPDPASSDAPRPRRRALPALAWAAFVALLGALVLGLYGQVLGNWFLRDDMMWLSDAGRQLEEPMRFFTTRPSNYFRPVGNVAFGLEYLLFGLDARGYYVANLALHTWNAAWLAALSWTLFGDRLAAAVSGLAFAAGGAWYGTALWISNIGGLAAAAALLPTLVAHVRFLRSGSGGFYACTVVGTALCVGAKECGIVIGPLLLLAEWRERGPASFLRGRTWLRYAPFVALAAGYAYMQRGMFGHGYFVSGGKRLGDWLVRAAASVGEMAWPLDVAPRSAAWIGVACALLLATAAAAAGGSPRRRDAIGLALALWLAFLPFVGFRAEPRPLISRYLYMPGLVFCLFAGRSAGAVMAAVRSRAGRGLGVAVHAAFALALVAWLAPQAVEIRRQSTAEHFRGHSLAMRGIVEQLRGMLPADAGSRDPRERWLFVGLPIDHPLHLRCLGSVFLGLPRRAFADERLALGDETRAEVLGAGGRGLLERYGADRLFVFVGARRLVPYEADLDPDATRLWQALLDSRFRGTASALLFVLSV